MIRCSTCGATHPANTLFCDECGQRLSPANTVEVKPRIEVSSADVSAPLPISMSTLDQSKQFDCTLNSELLIGRMDQSLAIRPDIDLSQLKEMAVGVSRRHARLLRSGEQVLLEDLNSLNGTFIRGMRLSPNSPQPVQSGDELQFGKVILKISF